MAVHEDNDFEGESWRAWRRSAIRMLDVIDSIQCDRVSVGLILVVVVQTCEQLLCAIREEEGLELDRPCTSKVVKEATFEAGVR